MADTPPKIINTRAEAFAALGMTLPNAADEQRAKEEEEARNARWNEMVQQCADAGRRMGDGEEVDFSFAPEVLHELTNKAGRLPNLSGGEGPRWLLGIVTRTAYRERLAELYLEASSCTLEQAVRVRDFRKLEGLSLFRLTPEERAAFDASTMRLAVLRDYCNALAFTEERDAVETPAALSAEDVAEARALVSRKMDNGTEDNTGGWHGGANLLQGSYLEHPAAAANVETFRRFRARVEMTPEDAERAIAAALDGKVSPREWLTEQGRESELEALEQGLTELAREETERELEEAKRATAEAEERAAEAERKLAEIQHKPLRIGTRAVKTHTVRNSDFVAVLRKLRKSKSITASTRKLLEREELIALRGDELLVSAGLLEVARQGGALQLYGPARARMGAVVFDTRIVVEEPPLEQFARLIGFKASAGGRVPSADRERVQAAMARLCDDVRPIVVESTVMHGKKRHTEFEIVRDVPVRRNTRADGSRVLEIHGSLALGYWWGHVLLSPQKWEEARQVIGARYTDDAMKWADVYFRRLVFGVVSEHKRKSTPAEQLAAGLPKRLKAAALREELQLEDYREKQGTAKTAKRLATIFDFCVAAGSLVSWEPDGAAYYRVTLPHPVEVEPEEIRAIQAEIFPMLTAGEVAAGGGE